jgi:hypothetical protein
LYDAAVGGNDMLQRRIAKHISECFIRLFQLADSAAAGASVLSPMMKISFAEISHPVTAVARQENLFL